MVQIMEENISSVLVLNKADLDFDRQSVEEQIKHISSQIPVFFTSIHQPETVSGYGSPYRKAKRLCLSVLRVSEKFSGQCTL